MGGKLWSPAEEKYFWEVIIPNSKFRTNPAIPESTWEELASMMQTHFGNNARRVYNDQLLAEHFYQNTRYEQASPNATAYVSRYISQYRISFGQDPPQGQRIGGARRQNKARHRKATATAAASTATAASEADVKEEDLFDSQDKQPDIAAAAEHAPSALDEAIGAEAQPTRIKQEQDLQEVGPAPGPGPQGHQHEIAPVQYPQLPHQGQQQQPAPDHNSQQQQRQGPPPPPAQGALSGQHQPPLHGQNLTQIPEAANNRRQLPQGLATPAQGPESRRQHHHYHHQHGFTHAPDQQQQAPQQGFDSGYGSLSQPQQYQQHQRLASMQGTYPQHESYQPRQLRELDAQQQQNYQPYQPQGASGTENEQAYLQNHRVAPARFPSQSQLRGPTDYGTLPQPDRAQHYGLVPLLAHPQNLQHPQRRQRIPSAPGPHSQHNLNQPATYVGPYPYRRYGVAPPHRANLDANLAQGGFPPPRPEPRAGNDTQRPPPWQSGGIIDYENPDRIPLAPSSANRIVLPPISAETAQQELDLGRQRQEQRSQQPTPTPDSTASRLSLQQASGHVQAPNQGHPLHRPSITRPSPAQWQQMQQRRHPLPTTGPPRPPQFPLASAFRMPATSYYDPQAQRAQIQPDQNRQRRSPQPIQPPRPVSTGPRPSLNLDLEPTPPSPPERTRSPAVTIGQLERSLEISNEAVAVAAVAAIAAANPGIFDSQAERPAEGGDE